MDINYIEIGLTAAGLIIANYGVKFVRVYPLIKKAYDLAEAKYEAKKDGVLTVEEKAKLYDKVEDLVYSSYSILKGFLPTKSKV